MHSFVNVNKYNIRIIEKTSGIRFIYTNITERINKLKKMIDYMADI